MHGDLFRNLTHRNIHPCTVVALFADIRGFTTFVQKNDLIVQDYVLDLLYFFHQAINEAHRENLKSLSPGNDFSDYILGAAEPKAIKTLGDGVMLVWEPPATSVLEIKDGFNIFILDFVYHLQNRFEKAINLLLGKYPHQEDLIEPLKLGIGISCGNAYRVESGGNTFVDFIGTPINIAARLQGEARPEGLVCIFDLLPNLILERISLNKEGEIKVVMPKGINHHLKVWFVLKPEITRRRARDSSSFERAQSTIEPEKDKNDTLVIPLSSKDTLNLFEIREDFEVQFVGELARRIAEKKLPIRALEEINPATRDRFHEGIAKLSTPNRVEGAKRAEFVDWAYNGTRIIHEYAKNDTPERVLAEHTKIFNAIKAGDVEKAQDEMKKHLAASCVEGKTGMIKEKEIEFKNEQEKLKITVRRK